MSKFWKQERSPSNESDPVLCYKSTPAKYLQKFGFIEDGHCQPTTLPSDQEKERAAMQPSRSLLDYHLQIYPEQCQQSQRCYKLATSNQLASINTMERIAMLKEAGCGSCLKASLDI